MKTVTRNVEKTAPVSARRGAERTNVLHHIQEAVQSVRHGVVQVIIQDGVVVQIERTEKQRLR